MPVDVLRRTLRWRLACLALLLLALVPTPPLFALDQPRLFFGPERFTRSSGAPTTFVRSFDLPATVVSTQLLVVINGGGNPQQAVTAGSINVDGRQVIGPRDLRRGVPLIERLLRLTPGRHTIEVRLEGQPGTFLTLTVGGLIRVGGLSQSRSGHSATLLGSGDILIAGGRGSQGALRSVEVFAWQTLTTTALPAPMAQARADHSATAMPTGATLLAGGGNASGVLGNAELTAAPFAAFSLLPAPMVEPRAGHSATLLPDGQVLILGGPTAIDHVADAEALDPRPDPRSGLLYDPRTGAFRSIPWALNVPRAHHTATLLPDGHVLVVGGSDVSDIASAELLDPLSGASTLLVAELATPRHGHSATLRPDGKVVIAGGMNGDSLLGSVELFDPATQSFTRATWPLLVRRTEHTATLLPSGEILVTGGLGLQGRLSSTELIGPPAADTGAPAVTSVFPPDGAADVARNTIVSLRFSEPVHPQTVDAAHLRLLAGSTPVAGTVAIAESGLVAFFVPAARLAGGTRYDVSVEGVRDLAGNPLPPGSSSFTTAHGPTITAANPSHAVAGTAVTLTGQGFEPVASGNLVRVGAEPATVTAASSTTLTLLVPLSAPAGATKISVETSGGRAEIDFVVDNPTPALVAIAPDRAVAGGATLSLAVTGTGFLAGATVRFGDVPVPTTFVDAGSLRGEIPAAELAVARTVPVTVRNPLPTGGPSNPLLFLVEGVSQASLGDFVWHDLDGDGLQDPGEPGLAGVVTRLHSAAGTLLASTQTAADGTYRFADLAPGDYVVEVVAPPGFAFTLADQGANDARDSDPDPTSGRTVPITVATGDQSTVDAGLVQPLATVQSSPARGEANVAVTRETILRFSRPLAPAAVISPANLFAIFAGQPLAARIHLAPDRRAVTLFYDRDLPASARVRVTFVGDAVVDELGRAVDADGDGTPGGTATIDFETLTLTTLGGTRVCGRVFASQLAPGAGNGSVNVPLPDVIITVDGMETTLRTVTDGAGNFCLDPAPVGEFFVHIDGRSSSLSVPAGDYYPVVGKRWQSTAGETVTIGDIYLPRVVAGTLQPVSRTEDTTITFPPAVLAEFPQLAGVQITVPADSLFADGGSRGGMVGIAPVPADRLPEPLPPALAFPLVITVQTDGGTNFDRPVPVCFPNLADPATGQVAPAGAKTGLFSFNHDTGRWELAGSATVSPDARLACSDPGQGILAPGWHGVLPMVVAASAPGPTEPPPPKTCDIVWNHPNPAQLRSQCQIHAGFASAGCIIVSTAVKTGPCRLLPNFIAKFVCGRVVSVPQNGCVNYFFNGGRQCLDFIDTCILTGNPPPQQLAPPSSAPRPDMDEAAVGGDLDALLTQAAALGVGLANDAVQHVRIQEPILDIMGNRDASELTEQELLQIEPLLPPVTGFLGGKTKDEFYGPRYLQLGALIQQLAPRLGILPRSSAHYLVENLDNGTVLRGRTEIGGAISNLILRPNARYRLRKVFPDTLRVAETQFFTPAAGQRIEIPVGYWSWQADQDTDGDGAFDFAELIVGTNIQQQDSDGDGLSDLAEIQQGTNPLDDRPVRTGVIANADTPGNAVDVCAANDLAAVADSEAGVSVFNVFNGMSPTVVAQVDTPGSARAVACAGNAIAVADGPAGLAVVDVTDPPAAAIVRQVPLLGNARAVTTAAGVAYVGLDTGSLVAIDLATGSLLQEITSSQGIHDLAIEGDVLYVAAANELRAYRLSVGDLELLGRVGISLFPEAVAGRRRVFAGGGFAYVTSYPGYDTIDASDPTALRLVGRATDAGPNSFKQIVANGSGLGVAAVGVNPREDGSHDVWLYDVTDPAVTTRLLAVLTTPGITRAVSIFHGLAYAADGVAGLQVLNYLPYDANGVPPTLTLRTNFAAGVAEEGQLMLLTASVADDVQVRKVEFFVDGARVLSDGSFPFEHRFVTPLREQQASFTLRACATDTGGNRTCTSTVDVVLTPDATPPRVKATTPRNGASEAEATVATVSATFTEPVDVPSLSTTTFRLFAAGPDSLIGTADDVPVEGGVVSYGENLNTAFLSFAAPLPVDLYRAALGTGIQDRAGNGLGSEFGWTFRVKRPASWINPAGGLWRTPANWSDNAVPGPTEIAFITLPGTYEVVLDQNTTVRRLILGATSGAQALWIKGSNAGGHLALNVTDGLINSGTIRIESADGGYTSALSSSNGTLTNLGLIRTVAGTGGARTISGNLENRGTLDIAYNATFSGTLTNDGDLQIAAGQNLALGGVLTQSSGAIRGTGSLVLNGATLNYNGGTVTELTPLLINSTLNFGIGTDPATFVITGGSSRAGGTIAAAQSLSVRGQNAGGHTTLTIPAGLTNNGTLRLESIEGGYTSRLSVTGGALTNRGTMESTPGSGGQRAVAGTLLNAGAFDVNATTSHSGTLTHTGTLTIAAGQALTLGAGDVLNFDGGTIAGAGTVTLNGATLNFNGGTTTGTPPLLINSLLNLGSSTGPASFVATGGTARATGTLAPGQFLTVRGQNAGGHTTLTLPSGLLNGGTLRLDSIEGGYTARVDAPAGTLTNRGTIEIAAGSGGARSLGGTLANEGRIDVDAEARFNGVLTHSGTLDITAKLILDPGQTFDFDGGTISGAGLLQLTSSTLTFDGGTTTGTPPLLVNSELAFGSSTGPARFVMSGGSGRASGTIAAGQEMWVRGSNAGGHTTVSLPSGLSNSGAIRLESIDGGYTSNLSGDLTNLGTLLINSGTGGSRVLSGNLVNQGAFEVNVSGSFTGRLVHTGSLDIAPGQALSLPAGQIFDLDGGTVTGAGQLTLNGSTLNFDGGSTTGTPILLVGSALHFGSGTDPASFVMTGNGTVSGEVAAGQLLSVRGQNAGGHTTVTAAAGFRNSGVTRLESIEGGYTANFTVTGGELTNTATGVLEVRLGAGGARTLTASVVNEGTLVIDAPATASSLTTAPGSTLRGNGTLTLGSGALANAGGIAPGSSPGRFTLGAALTQQSTASLGIEVGGASPVTQYDQLALSQPATLDGALDVTLVGGFEPALGQTFDIVSFPSRTGTFATSSGLSIGNGKRFQINYEPTRVRLEVVPE